MITIKKEKELYKITNNEDGSDNCKTNERESFIFTESNPDLALSVINCMKEGAELAKKLLENNS